MQPKRCGAARSRELVGTALLVTVVVGSGIMATDAVRRRRPAAAGELDRDRVRAGRAHPDVRAGVRRPLQPGRVAGRLVARPPRRTGPDRLRARRLRRRAGRRGDRRRGAREPDVRPAAGRLVAAPTRDRAAPVAGRGGRHRRADPAGLRRSPASGRAAVAPRRGRRLHRRRVLVHLVDQLRQPGRHRRPGVHRHVRRHRARPRVPGFVVAQVVGLRRVGCSALYPRVLVARTRRGAAARGPSAVPPTRPSERRNSDDRASPACCSSACTTPAGRRWPPAGCATSPATRSRCGRPVPRRPSTINPVAVEAMREVGIDITGNIPTPAGVRHRVGLRRHRDDGLRRRLPGLSRQALRGLEARRPGRAGHRRRAPDPRRDPRPGGAARRRPRTGTSPT